MSKPLFSIVIPACDEEHYLPKCLAAIDAARDHLSELVEVIVVDNLSHDHTVDVAREWGAKVVTEDRKCLSAVRNRGAQEAAGTYLAFIDADSLMSANMLSAIRAVMDSGRYAGGGVANVRPDRWSLGIVCSGLMLAPLLLWARVACVMFYTTPEAFWAVGGFDEERYAVEDLDFGMRLKRWGKKQGLRYKALWQGKVVTSARKMDEFGDWVLVKRPILVWRAAMNDRKTAHDIWYRRRR